MARKEVSCKKLEISCKKGSRPFTASSSSRRGTCLLARSVQLSNLINLGEQDFFTWPGKEHGEWLIAEIFCPRQGFRYWAYGNHHAGKDFVLVQKRSNFALSLHRQGLKYRMMPQGTPGSSCASAASGKDQERRSWCPQTRIVNRNILQVKFTLLLKWCYLLCFSCCVCGVCMWKSLLCDDNKEAYDLNLIWSEVDGGFYDIGDHLAGYKLAYDGPG